MDAGAPTPGDAGEQAARRQAARQEERLQYLLARARREHKRSSWSRPLDLAFGLFTVALLFVGLVQFVVRDSPEVNRTWVWILVGSVSVIAGAFAIPWFFERRKYMRNQNVEFEQRIAAEREYHAQALEKLKQASELATLMQVNQEQIKTYHDIVTEQADKSFKSSRTAMSVGLILLVAAAVGGAWVPLEQVRWFIGALAAFSTLLSGYLSRTYLALYRESIGQLNRYFDQPVANSYYLTAERLTSGLDLEHAQAVRQQIVDRVLENSRIGSASTQASDGGVGVAPVKKKPKKTKKAPTPLNGTPKAATGRLPSQG